ncbi:hypothetical protein ACOI22_03855 [Glaciecola sp. 2405UD65-10]|uniref:hypothetical protein n=1 Tax=Glaciecola sp. 2405UD65-10 TaxID=3397244 RepID=UPI003B5C06F8
MLYAIKTKLNDFIKENLEHAMLIRVDVASDVQYPFTQSVDIDDGVIISAGYDEYLPGSTLKEITGRFEYDSDNSEIRVYQGDKLKFKIVKAQGPAYNDIMSYEGQYRPEDVARIKKHIAQMQSAGRGYI